MIYGKYSNFQFWVSQDRKGKVVVDGKRGTLGDFMNNGELNPEAPIKLYWAYNEKEAKKKFLESIQQ